ncbi:MAG: hypothetical protein ACK559_39985, partial [bacterium]
MRKVREFGAVDAGAAVSLIRIQERQWKHRCWICVFVRKAGRAELQSGERARLIRRIVGRIETRMFHEAVDMRACVANGESVGEGRVSGPIWRRARCPCTHKWSNASRDEDLLAVIGCRIHRPDDA